MSRCARSSRKCGLTAIDPQLTIGFRTSPDNGAGSVWREARTVETPWYIHDPAHGACIDQHQLTRGVWVRDVRESAVECCGHCATVLYHRDRNLACERRPRQAEPPLPAHRHYVVHRSRLLH